MILHATVDGRAHRVEVAGSGGGYTVTVDGEPHQVDWRAAGGVFFSLLDGAESHCVGLEPRPDGYRVLVGGDEFVVDFVEAARAEAGTSRAAPGPARLTAPMPGRIVRVLVEPGQAVESGQGLVVMEAMKMENELRSPRTGRVVEVRVGERQTVETGVLLVVVE